jgi:hypothetical protein
MVLSTLTLKHDYWEAVDLNEGDLERIYDHLLEIETPMTPEELAMVFIDHRLMNEKKAAEQKQSEGGKPYLPKEEYQEGDKIAFPSLDWKSGIVTGIRDPKSYDDRVYKVVEVEFPDGEQREFASGLSEHALNEPVDMGEGDPLLNPDFVMESFGETITEKIVATLEANEDFVYIAGRWFPRALLIDVNIGNLNLAEAVLDMAGGGPLATGAILAEVGLPEGINPNLAGFSLDLALQDDQRFDEVGAVGEVSWFLKRLEPEEVQQTPIFLRYHPVDYDRGVLSEQMLALEQRLDDELSEALGGVEPVGSSVSLPIIFPHWRSGTLPLSSRLEQFFPTAYESPRVRFLLVDGDTGEKFPGWVVRNHKYVYGLRDWYLEKGVMPGSMIKLEKGKNPGEVIVSTEPHISAKEWVRTALVGADGGVVYAMLKQPVSTTFEDWMMISMPSTDTSPLDHAWEERVKTPLPFEQVVVETLKELAKLNPQAHVHAAELYSAVNVVYRCPPGPILAVLNSRPWFDHVGDLHFRYKESTGE